jgi:formylglycine-generating enzyme required for sulfatase activity
MMNRARWLAAAFGLAAAQLGAAAFADAIANDFRPIPAGRFESVIAPQPGVTAADVRAFDLAITPVTNAQFAAFVRAQPAWRRGRVAPLFADTRYLAHWPDAETPTPAQAQQPVTQVSWFAARAYCAAQGGRLPTWHEWEYAAAADATRRDARADPAWRQRLLDWYAQPADELLPAVGQSPANVYGVRDLHGLVWEWVDDAGSLMVSADNRDQGDDPDLLKFCGSGAVTMEQKDQYAVLMRVAMLSSLKASYTTATLGFRCARDADGESR